MRLPNWACRFVGHDMALAGISHAPSRVVHTPDGPYHMVMHPGWEWASYRCIRCGHTEQVRRA